jgi:hypothetical protein
VTKTCAWPTSLTRRVLLALAFVVATAGVITAMALPSIDPCRHGDQVLPGCTLVTPTFDRIGLRVTIGAVGLLAGAAMFLSARGRGLVDATADHVASGGKRHS